MSSAALTREASSLSAGGGRWDRELVRVQGTVMTLVRRTPKGAGESGERAILWVGDPAPDCRFPDSPRVRGRAVCVLTDPGEHVRPGVGGTWVGRVVTLSSTHGLTVVDTTISRFTAESVAGLVVGAMGVFVFALHFRRWLLERRPRSPA
jgi:hypothetical protein